MSALTIVRGTMVVATLAWTLGEVLMRRSPASDRLARAASTIGIALAILHVLMAFAFVYAWDHDVAAAATGEQTAQLVGRGWPGGIYVNYFFLMLWLADVWWWWLAPVSHTTRSMRLERARLALFTFMFFNGAVVFASAATRMVGIAAVTAVLIGSPVLRRQTVAS